VGEDSGVEVPQLAAGFDAQLRHEAGAGVAVDSEGVGLAS
jgi:hypothetical protein